MSADFHARIRAALKDQALQQALARNAERRAAGRQAAFAEISDLEAMRQRAHQARQRMLKDLDGALEAFSRRARANGMIVHRAADARQACRLVCSLLEDHGARLVVKSKSMVTEEIGINAALEALGFQVVETDLGEYIVQLRGEPPSHIITPAVHLRREDVARTFSDRLGVPYDPSIETLTRVARERLRETFLAADAGISGVNFGVVETGTLCLVTNEGNGRMVTSLPPLHIAIIGVERLVRDPAELALMLELLPRSATGQRITSYVSLIQGPAQKAIGPQARHLILVDNGRRALARSDLQEALLCIRCGACLNACPVFRHIGGHAYASVYPGPIGSVVSPALFGLQRYGHLAHASTLCGACREACPVDIDLPGLLLRTRRQRAERAPLPRWMRAGLALYTVLATRPRLFRLAQSAIALATRLLPRRAGWLRALPPPLSRWTATRDFPPFARRPFRAPGQPGPPPPAIEPAAPPPDHAPAPPPRQPPAAALEERFRTALEAVDGQLQPVRREELASRLVSWLQARKVNSLSLSLGEEWDELSLREALQRAGFQVLLPQGKDGAAMESLRHVDAGITGALLGFADTGSILIAETQYNPHITSLLPPVHIALLPAAALRPSLAHWLASESRPTLGRFPALCLITGPSRTADIEMTLTLGVHGPGELSVFLVDE
jgi:L-lactate dehydrogenase complex protein LldF